MTTNMIYDFELSSKELNDFLKNKDLRFDLKTNENNERELGLVSGYIKLSTSKITPEMKKTLLEDFPKEILEIVSPSISKTIDLEKSTFYFPQGAFDNFTADLFEYILYVTNLSKTDVSISFEEEKEEKETKEEIKGEVVDKTPETIEVKDKTKETKDKVINLFFTCKNNDILAKFIESLLLFSIDENRVKLLPAKEIEKNDLKTLNQNIYVFAKSKNLDREIFSVVLEKAKIPCVETDEFGKTTTIIKTTSQNIKEVLKAIKVLDVEDGIKMLAKDFFNKLNNKLFQNKQTQKIS
ncbi:MAG: hypothetical protein ACRC4M_04640 [Mycoplasma sp.]